MQCAGIVVPGTLTSCNDSEDCRIVPTESQLSIIDRYAHRVRFLDMMWYDWESHLVQSFLQTLAYSSKVLMPNLRCLSGAFMLHLLRPLPGPRLQDITIDSVFKSGKDNFSERTALHVALQTLYSCCPSLEKFRFGTYDHLMCSRIITWDAHTARAASHSIEKLQKLRTVAVPAITKDALAYLGCLSCLISLETHLPTGSDFEDVFRSSRTPLPFRNLRSIVWDIDDWAHVEVFTRIWSHRLTELSLRSKVHFDPGLLEIVLESFHTREAFKYLQSIRFSELSLCPLTTTIIITINTIRPLFHLNHLRVVYFDTRSSIWVDNNDLKKVAEAWPCLEEFSLNDTYGCHNPAPGVTLPGLVEFIELCPHLTTLCIGTITLAGVDMPLDEDFHMDNFEPCRSSVLELVVARYPYTQERRSGSTWDHRLTYFFESLFRLRHMYTYRYPLIVRYHSEWYLLLTRSTVTHLRCHFSSV
ncbi:uncharacterized protein BJ212DRAFT_539519 [Suillus subaureus]|uniref:F-box domain-containing protein n=1 Tax=Suillus subaureus TaxID=48587 RepID=A0A9P7JI88_9AGAM|nr:uncharacterized protein BJ212DRAFT_539519 [Suillus subaureus]KAG1824619.1 hypothetical protein BJ212DRAFT_539519 [Suillus subaureus]